MACTRGMTSQGGRISPRQFSHLEFFSNVHNTFDNNKGRKTPPPGLGNNIDLRSGAFGGLGVFPNNNYCSVSPPCIPKIDDTEDKTLIKNNNTGYTSLFGFGNCNISSLPNQITSFEPINEEELIQQRTPQRCVTPPPTKRKEFINTPPRIKNSPGNRKKDTTHIQQSIKKYTSNLNDSQIVSFNDIKMASFHNIEDKCIDNIINHTNQMNNQSKDFLCDKLSKFLLINQHKIHSNFSFGHDIFDTDDNNIMNISFFRKIECKNCNQCIECKQNVLNNLTTLMNEFTTFFKGNYEDLPDNFSSWMKNNDEKKMYCQKYCIFKKINISENMSCEGIARKLDENGLIKSFEVDFKQKNDAINSHPLGKIIFPDTPKGKIINCFSSLRIQLT